MTYGTLIQTVTVGAGGAANISFSSIPSTYTDLYLVINARTDYTGTDGCPIFLRFNGSSANYSNRALQYADAVGARSASNQFGRTDELLVAQATGSGSSSIAFSNAATYIPNYNSNVNKVLSSEIVNSPNSTTDYSYVVSIIAGLWSNTAAITSIVLTAQTTGANNFVQYSTASLYGIK